MVTAAHPPASPHLILRVGVSLQDNTFGLSYQAQLVHVHVVMRDQDRSDRTYNGSPDVSILRCTPGLLTHTNCESLSLVLSS